MPTELHSENYYAFKMAVAHWLVMVNITFKIIEQRGCLYQSKLIQVS